MRGNSSRLSEFILYLIETAPISNDGRLPSLAELSKRTGMSIASLREQMEAARTFGFVEAKPKTGIRRLPYSFRPAICQSVTYAVSIDPGAFQSFSDMRNRIESAYWFQAVELLTQEDIMQLRALVQLAKSKLSKHPIQIPHLEHRNLHLKIFSRLNNLFVVGFLEAYWDVYEAIGMDVYTDFEYLQRVWEYHDRMVEAIANGDYTSGHQALIDHMTLIQQRSQPLSRQRFE
jgi:DNA-binding FadR family transcriptional regulator